MPEMQLSFLQEMIMDKIGDLTNHLFIGGSAGDDLKFNKTHVFANGKAYSNAAVLALLKPKASFDIIKLKALMYLTKNLLLQGLMRKKEKLSNLIICQK
jgi:hypothetical protein